MVNNERSKIIVSIYLRQDQNKIIIILLKKVK